MYSHFAVNFSAQKSDEVGEEQLQRMGLESKAPSMKKYTSWGFRKSIKWSSERNIEVDLKRYLQRNRTVFSG